MSSRQKWTDKCGQCVSCGEWTSCLSPCCSTSVHYEGGTVNWEDLLADIQEEESNELIDSRCDLILEVEKFLSPRYKNPKFLSVAVKSVADALIQALED